MAPRAPRAEYTPQSLSAEIAAGTFASAYYFFGSEDYRIVEAEKFVVRAFLPKGQQMTNYRRIDGRRTPCAELLAELAAYPMLGEKTVVAVTDIQHYKPNDVERILKLISPTDPSRVVIFSTPSARQPKGNAAIVLAMRKIARVVEFKRLTPTETQNQIERNLKKYQLTIDRDASELLTRMIDGNRGGIEAETEKLSSYKEAGEKVTLEDVRRLGAGYVQASVFEIGEQVLTGQAETARKRIRQLIADGNNPTGILYFLGQHLLSVYLVKNGRHLEPFRRWLEPRLANQGRQFSNAQLEAGIQLVAETDAQMRQGLAPPDLLLETTLIRLGRMAESSDKVRV